MLRPEDQAVELFRSYSVEEIEKRHGQVALGSPPYRGFNSSEGLDN